MEVIRTALASYGMSGLVFHGPLLKVHPGFEVKMILERNKALSRSKHPEAILVRSYDELLKAQEIELVIVNTPDYLHYEMAKEALEAGKHIVVEKPFTLTAAEGEEILELAEQKNLMVSVFQNRRWDGDFLTVKKVIEENKLGRLVSYESHFDRFRNYIQESWKEEKSLGAGTLYNLGSHMIDQALHLFGLPEYIFADVRAQRTGSQVDDSFDIIMHYGEVKCLVRGSYLVKEEGPRYILHGTDGSFLKSGLDPQEEALKLGMLADQKDWGSDDPDNYGILNSIMNGKDEKKRIKTENGNYLAFYDNIYKHLREGHELAVKGQEALDVIRIIEAAYASAEKGEVVKI